MTQPTTPHSLASELNQWLTAEILKLSVDSLAAGVLTCTACADSTTGEYVIEYQNETFRFSPEKTYAFLKFVAEEASQNHR